MGCPPSALRRGLPLSIRAWLASPTTAPLASTGLSFARLKKLLMHTYARATNRSGAARGWREVTRSTRCCRSMVMGPWCLGAKSTSRRIASLPGRHPSSCGGHHVEKGTVPHTKDLLPQKESPHFLTTLRIKPLATKVIWLSGYLFFGSACQAARGAAPIWGVSEIWGTLLGSCPKP